MAAGLKRENARLQRELSGVRSLQGIVGRSPLMQQMIEVLEQDLGVPVVTANQATMWHAVRLSGVLDRVPNSGALFGLSLS